MAKQNGNNEPTTETVNAPQANAEGFAYEAPEGARKVSTRSDGFWDEKSGVPVYGKLMFAREFKPKRGPSAGKTKQYYVVKLLARTKLAEEKNKNKPARVGEVDQMVGIMATPGLADVKMMNGCDVWIKRNPESEFIDTGMPSKMKTYDVRVVNGKPGVQVKVLEFDANQEDSDERETAEMGEIPF